MKHILRATALMPVLATCAVLRAQSEPNPPQPSAVPTVTFTCNWPIVEPQRYEVAVDSGGNAVYRSWTAGSPGEQSDAEDSYVRKFTMSPAVRDRIFFLARQLNYFNGDFEYHKHRVASSGQKTLTYADADKQYTTRYDWSENAAVSELTTWFRGMSATIEAGRRLQHLYRFDRLGLDEEMKNLEHLASDHQATELQLIAPVLEQLTQDPAVLNIARQRARHILQMAGVASAGDGQAPHQ